MLRIVWSTADWARAVAELPREGALATSMVLIPKSAVAHALRKELVRAGGADVLCGTRFLGASIAAREVLTDAGVDFVPGEEALRSARILRLLRDGLPLEYFDRPLLTTTSGWDDAFSQTISDLEAAGLTPDELPTDAEPHWRDVAAVWRAADLSARRSWSTQKILFEAARILEVDPQRWPFEGPVLAAVTGHETSAYARFVRAIPRIELAVHGARPKRHRHLTRVRQLFGVDAAAALETATAPRAHGTEREVLASYLFEPAELLAAKDRPRSRGDDGTVSLEEHAGLEAEVEATADWVARQISERGVPLEEIAVLPTRADPFAALLVDRLHRLLAPESDDPPVFVAGGLPARTSPSGARLSAVIRALRGHLGVDRLADVLPVLRASADERRIARGAALDLAYSLGTAGGNPAHPEGALEWAPRIRARRARAAFALEQAARDDDDPRALAKLERQLQNLSALEPAIVALVDVARRVLTGEPLGAFWPALRDFFRTHLVAPVSSILAVSQLDESITALCADPMSGALRGDDALLAIDEALDRLRLPVGTFGEARVYVGQVQGALGLRFAATRVIGLVEGTIPSSPTEDPVLPAHLRVRFEARGLVAPSDRAAAQLHAIDRIVRDTTGAVALSHARQGADRSYREASSVVIEAAAALGRGVDQGAPRIPNGHALRRHSYAPARAAWRAFRTATPILDAAWHDRVATGRAGLPRVWLTAPHLDLERVRFLSSDDEVTALDGILGAGKGAPALVIPGLTAERPISASGLATFLGCPHRFLFERVFHFGAPFAPPPQRSLPAHVYGKLVHDSLEHFYALHGEHFADRRRTVEEWLVEAVRSASSTFEEYLEQSPLTSEGVRRAQRERVIEDVKRFVRHDWSQKKARFVAVERPFTAVGWRDVTGEFHLHLQGRIDRIDASRVTFVRDVKTGKPHPREPNSPAELARDLQLAVYAHVARTSAPEWETPARVSSEYVYVGARGVMQRTWDAGEDALQEAGDNWLSLAARMMSVGVFPRTVNDEDCKYCDFKPTCGKHRIARAERTLDGRGGVLKDFAELKEGK